MNSPETNSFRNTPFQCDLDALMHAAQAFVSPHDVIKDEDRRSAKSGASLHLGRFKPARAKPPWCGTCPEPPNHIIPVGARRVAIVRSPGLMASSRIAG
jgi:hypothetical protein